MSRSWIQFQNHLFIGTLFFSLLLPLVIFFSHLQRNQINLYIFFWHLLWTSSFDKLPEIPSSVFSFYHTVSMSLRMDKGKTVFKAGWILHPFPYFMSVHKQRLSKQKLHFPCWLYFSVSLWFLHFRRKDGCGGGVSVFLVWGGAGQAGGYPFVRLCTPDQSRPSSAPGVEEHFVASPSSAAWCWAEADSGGSGEEVGGRSQSFSLRHWRCPERVWHGG